MPAKVTGLPAIADDSGLAVDALGGAPGIYSARYSGEDATDQKNLQKLLQTMKDVPDDQRQARFHSVLVYLRHPEDPTPLVCHGCWPGVITREPAGTVGFGYDPIFFVPYEGKTAAELTREVKRIFFGCGTPILLSGPAMQTRLDGVRARLPLAADAEITMEANPGTVEADRFVDYQRAGVNRISIGVQSFSEEKLKRLGRIHGPQEAKRAAKLASGLGLRPRVIPVKTRPIKRICKNCWKQ